MLIDFDKMLIIIDSMVAIESSQTLPAMTVAQLDRFISRLPFKGIDECWEWEGTRNQKSYGLLLLSIPGMGHNKGFYASRLVYRFFYGEDPGAMMVCHKCDNPPCCNPAHLFLGTAKDNNQDRTRKARTVRGEAISLSKLTVSQVLEIRQRDASRKRGRGSRSRLFHQLGLEFNVHPNTISDIVYGITWKHLLPNYTFGDKVVPNPDRYGKSQRHLYNAAMTESDVAEIRKAVSDPDRKVSKTYLMIQYAKKLGVRPSTIKRAIYGETWSHVSQ